MRVWPCESRCATAFLTPNAWSLSTALLVTPGSLRSRRTVGAPNNSISSFTLSDVSETSDAMTPSTRLLFKIAKFNFSVSSVPDELIRIIE